jgi:hypothetical protein
LTGPAPQPRDKLVTLLWGSHFEVQARQNLRQALSRLRRALGQDALISDGDEISLAPGVIDCDAARLEGLVREGSRASLAEAVGLYKQRLLAGVAIPEEAWADWVAGEGQRLEGLALDAPVRFGEIELAQGHADIRWLEPRLLNGSKPELSTASKLTRRREANCCRLTTCDLGSAARYPGLLFWGCLLPQLQPLKEVYQSGRKTNAAVGVGF